MSIDTQSILCGACRVPIEGPANPKSDDMFTCPECGRSDTLKHVIDSATAYVIELAQLRLQESMRKAARGSKLMKFEGKPIPKKTHRFITDHKF